MKKTIKFLIALFAVVLSFSLFTNKASAARVTTLRVWTTKPVINVKSTNKDLNRVEDRPIRHLKSNHGKVAECSTSSETWRVARNGKLIGKTLELFGENPYFKHGCLYLDRHYATVKGLVPGKKYRFLTDADPHNEGIHPRIFYKTKRANSRGRITFGPIFNVYYNAGAPRSFVNRIIRNKAMLTREGTLYSV